MSTLYLPNQIEVGAGSINKLKNAILSINASRTLVIMNAFFLSPPINLHKKIREIFNEIGIDFKLFTNFTDEPTTEHVANALKCLNHFHADSIIAIGGGSTIDISKSVSLFGKSPHLDWSIISNQDYLGKLPLIAIPTTAGTGSEVTGITVISDSTLGIKLNPGHPHLIPDIAILDPELTVSLPKNFTAFTGMDALAHAIEAYVSNRATFLTDSYAINAIKIISKSLPIVYENGSNIRERQNMMLASCYAGTAFFNSSTNLAHAAGRALGNKFNVPHGLSVAVLLPYVMEFGLDSAPERYRDIAIGLGADPSKNDMELANHSIKLVEDYNKEFEIWNCFAKYIRDIKLLEIAIPTLVEETLSGNGIKTNRKLPNRQDVKEIFNSIVNQLKVNKKQEELQ